MLKVRRRLRTSPWRGTVRRGKEEEGTSAGAAFYNYDSLNPQYTVATPPSYNTHLYLWNVLQTCQNDQVI